MTDFATQADTLYSSAPAAPVAAPAPRAAPAAPAPAARAPVAPVPPVALPRPVSGGEADYDSRYREDGTARTDPQSDESPDAEQEPVTIEQRIAAIEKSIPSNVAELRADPLRKMFPAVSTFNKVLPDSAFASPDQDSAITVAIAREVREMAADVGLSSEDIPGMANAMSKPPMTQAELRVAADRVIDLLNQEFGQNASEALADARLFVAQDPRRAALLRLGRAGNDPRIVLRIAQLARQAKASGKF